MESAGKDQFNKTEEPTKSDRRKFLNFISLGILGAILGPILVASKRFLEPAIAVGSETSAENWKTLGSLTELNGGEPLARTISVEKINGWSRTIEDVTVYVLPQDEHKVLSSVCPHEGCPVVWDSNAKNFLCPCHDSFFSENGKKLSGPSASDLTALETRIEENKLQVKI